MLNFEEPLKVVLDNNVNMDLFVSKNEVIKQYTDQFKGTLWCVDTSAQYIEHSNDFIMGEEILGLHNYANTRVYEKGKKERGEKYNKIIDNEHITIPLDDLVLDMYFYSIKIGSKYFEFLNDISLDYLVNNFGLSKANLIFSN